SFGLVQQVYRVCFDVRPRNFRENVFLSTCRCDFSTLFRKFACRSHADSARSSRDDRHFAVEFHLISPCKLNLPTRVKFPECRLARKRISRRATYRIPATQNDLLEVSQKMQHRVWIGSRRRRSAQTRLSRPCAHWCRANPSSRAPVGSKTESSC